MLLDTLMLLLNVISQVKVRDFRQKKRIHKEIQIQ